LAPRDSVNRAFYGATSSANNGSTTSRPNAARAEDGEVIETTWRVVD
jgi:hypothetical protein